MKNNITPNFETLRRVEVWVNDMWVIVQMHELVIDEVFRLFEHDGTAVNNGRKWVVVDYPYENPDGIWMVDCEPISYAWG